MKKIFLLVLSFFLLSSFSGCFGGDDGENTGGISFDYEIIDFTDNISDIKIYTTKENIEKIKINENKYWS